MSKLSVLSESVDRTTIDRRLADEIQKRIEPIKHDIAQKGFSLIELDGKTFRITDIPEEVTTHVQVTTQRAG